LVSTVAATRLDLQDALMLASMGAFTVPIAARYPLDGVHDALDALRERRVLGRQVLDLTG
jgi:D-arabinose 1-dehydrogenase-like Zn-dependent alcohol dehydrogenase